MEALAAVIPPYVAPQSDGAAELAVVESSPQQTSAIEDLTKKVDTVLGNLGGFKFSGDFRFRADVQARSANAVAGPLQNIRSRYRVRLNADKDIDSKFRFHLQLSTGPYNVQTTNDQEFGAMAVKQPFSISEAFLDYHPGSRISIRGGRMDSCGTMMFASMGSSKQQQFLFDRRHSRRLNSDPRNTF